MTSNLPRVFRFLGSGSTNKWRRKVGYSAEVVYHCILSLRHDKAPQMASALTYRTIFSLVPILALALMVFNSMGGFEKMSGPVQQKLYNYFGLSSLTYQDGSDAGGQAEIKASIDEKLSELTNKVSSVDFARIGAVGLLLFIYAAIALVVAMEGSFNEIYNAPRGRPWHLRIAIYWAAITLGPVLLSVSLYASDRLARLSQDFGAGAGQGGTAAPHGTLYFFFSACLVMLMNTVTRLAALLASWLLIFLIYRLMPNTRVHTRPALIGSFVAALLWETGKWAFQLYVHRAVAYSVIYGSLGLVPLFLFWVYLTWIIVIFGLEISYTLQTMKSGRFKYASRGDDELFYDPRWLIPITGVIGRAFTDGRTVTAEQLAQELSLPLQVVNHLSDRLEAAGVIHRTQARDEGEPAYALARPPEKIAVETLVDLSRSLASDPLAGPHTQSSRDALPGSRLIEAFTQAQRAAAKDVTLATLIQRAK